MNQDLNKEKSESFNDKIEKEIQEKGLTAPRVTKEHIDALMRKVILLTGKVSETRILCSATLDGFVIADGFSACISPENFDEQIGIKIAQQNAAKAAYDKLWELEGYLLSRRLFEEKSLTSPVKE